GLYMPAMNSIFISQASPDKDLTFHHEFLHFNYGYMTNTPEMREYLNEIMEKNPALLKQFKEDYSNRIQYALQRYIAERRSRYENQIAIDNLTEKIVFQLDQERHLGGNMQSLSRAQMEAIDKDAAI